MFDINHIAKLFIMAVVYFQCMSVKPADNSSSYHESNALHTKGAIYYIFIIYNIFGIGINLSVRLEKQLVYIF